MNPYLNQYKNNQINTASPEQIMIMLYDGALRFLAQAMQGIDDNDIELKNRGIQKAMAIVMEFRNTLDHNIGGEIAANLDALYDYMIREMIQANLKKDRQKLQAVHAMLADLRDTWKEAIVIAGNESRLSPAVNAGYQPLKASL
ncbi:MAG: flagellar export chaperone FliS [Syntrophotalea acetylenica]|jgi:flagellar protein FliS|uniref:Flagellar secretion chaperone FliS n=1 Tax=Syntrophotalea acetylenica TaxID=29542 RepID=A0A1L3GDL9_SYNAC|nr:flagellar export chaperone FliS [Syntrophotalea acetylenica]APG23798.1 flagellar export chaperone FliS [Syntrophotalea acetylenica]APG44380.1 flagellar export chaperone FliS [Syntrophotalea acetylenica]MDD4456798.1 flagellar export chaperone FliS [Syntrophotalea acetylenica]